MLCATEHLTITYIYDLIFIIRMHKLCARTFFFFSSILPSCTLAVASSHKQAGIFAIKSERTKCDSYKAIAHSQEKRITWIRTKREKEIMNLLWRTEVVQPSITQHWICMPVCKEQSNSASSGLNAIYMYICMVSAFITITHFSIEH